MAESSFANVEYVVRTIMHGLTGPLDDKTYTNVMVPMGAQTNDWIAAIASYIRNDSGTPVRT